MSAMTISPSHGVVTPGSFRMEPPTAPHGGRAVIIECYGGHGECLEFQARSLQRAGFEVEIWIARKNCWRADGIDIRLVLLDGPIAFQAANLLWRALPDLLVFNTATGPIVRDLLALMLPSGVATIGVFHDVAKVRSHVSTRLIARMLTARVMLARHLARSAEEAIDLPFAHVHLLAPVEPAQPDTGEVVVAIPGAFGAGKKDIEALMEVLLDPRLDKRVRFALLGSYPRSQQAGDWWQRCGRYGVQQRLIRFDGYVPPDVFAGEIRRSAAVLPLIHPPCRYFTAFTNDKISGAVNVALGAHLPLLIHRELGERWDFGPVIRTYGDHASLVTTINSLADRRAWQSHRRSIARSSEAQRSHQQALYVRMCASALRGRRPLLVRRTIPEPQATIAPRRHIHPIPALHPSSGLSRLWGVFRWLS